MTTAKERKLLKAFGRRMAQLRRQRGLTQQELAEKTNLSVVAIGYIETGKRWVRISTLNKISKALKTDIHEFFKDL